MRGLAIGGLALGLALVIVWALPAAIGPFSVECGDLEPPTCDEVWRRAADEFDDGMVAFLPVTGVRIGEMTEESLCGSVQIERWIFGTTANHYCH